MLSLACTQGRIISPLAQAFLHWKVLSGKIIGRPLANPNLIDACLIFLITSYFEDHQKICLVVSHLA